MISTVKGDQAIARTLIALGLATLLTGVALGIVSAARADSTPVGPLPRGPITTYDDRSQSTRRCRAPARGAAFGTRLETPRRYDPRVAREISGVDVGANVVFVFKVIGRGNTSLVFALTRGDTSSKAVKAATHKIRSR